MEKTKIIEILKDLRTMFSSKTESELKKNFVKEMDEAIQLPKIFEAFDGPILALGFNGMDKKLTEKYGENWFDKCKTSFELSYTVLDSIINAFEMSETIEDGK